MQFSIIGSGSWATALTKILSDNGHPVAWWIRNQKMIDYIKARRHNPQYLNSAFFDVSLLTMSSDVNKVFQDSDVVVLAVPSQFVPEVLKQVQPELLQTKKIVSAIKGIIPCPDVLLNDYLQQHFNVPLENYFAILGPFHADEVEA